MEAIVTDPNLQLEEAWREISRLKEQVREEHERYLRTLADFVNYRRRTEIEYANAAEAGKQEVFLLLLEVMDNFELALKHIPDATEAISDGVRAIHRQLNALLAKHGVTPFESLGERFNPDLHEALAAVESEQHESGTITDELRRGYRSGNAVLRHAQVFVAKGADPTGEP